MLSNTFEKRIAKFRNKRVLVIGEAILDSYLIGRTDRLCREAPVPIVDVQGRIEVPGGAAHTAVNIATLGAEAVFLTVLGEDAAAATLINNLKATGVNTDSIIVDPEHQTLVKQRIRAEDQIVVRCDQGSTNAIPAETEARLIENLQALAPECDAILVSDYAYGVITPAVVAALAEVRRHFQGVLAIDSKRLSLFRECCPTLIKPSYEQAVALLQVNALSNGLRTTQIQDKQDEILQITGAQIAAVTLDTDGALIFECGQTLHRTYAKPADHANAVGAGDSYISAFTLALVAGASTHEAAELAAAAGQIVVRDAGTTPCSWQALLDHLRRQQGDNGKRITNRRSLAEIVDEHRQHNRRIVFTNGCFDILHAGHVKYLAQAKALGDVLIVGVNSDSSVVRLKGPERPINMLYDRLAVLSALESVDHVMAFEEETPMALIKIVRPDIFVKGGDYSEDSLPEASLVRELGGRVEIMPYVINRSTTQLIESIRRNEGSRSSLSARSLPFNLTEQQRMSAGNHR